MAAMMAGCWLRAALLRRAARSVLKFSGWLEVFVLLISRNALCLPPCPFLHRARARRVLLEGSSGRDRHGLNRWQRRAGRMARAIRPFRTL